MVGFSVWGRPENSPKFTIPDIAKEKLGMTTSVNPSFHLHDINKLKGLVSKAGFSKVLAWYSVLISSNAFPVTVT